MIKLPKGIQENLQFLSLEIDTQLANMQHYFAQADAVLAGQLLDRAGYADNLQARIHSSVIDRLATHDLESHEIFSLRRIEFIANDLAAIAAISRNCIQQAQTIGSIDGLASKSYIKMLKQVQQAVLLVVPALEHSDSTIAVKIGQVHASLDEAHEKLQQKYTTAVQNRKNARLVLAAVYLAHEFKQYGEALLRIGESIISVNAGQPVSLDRYASMQSLASNMDVKDQSFAIEAIAETRSGAAISSLHSREHGALGVYKSGQKQKLKEERKGVNSWHELYPGLAPKILAYQKKGGSAALLIEHLPGQTFEQIVLHESDALFNQAQKKLHQTLRTIWTETKIEKSADAGFMRQLQNRLVDVYKVHPEFVQGDVTICGQAVTAFDELLKAAVELEKRYPSNFSVYIHGDFNVDNIMYDAVAKRIHFIDLHRSCYMDYVQDVSVFMVSNYRLQAVSKAKRARMMCAAKDLYAAARRHALKQGDSTFEMRLILGLARSFATSTRFILDKNLAREMFLRARYLIELALRLDATNTKKIRLPLKEIFVE